MTLKGLGGRNLFGFGVPTSAVDPFGLAKHGDVGTMDSLGGPANRGDNMDRHELLQSAWLEHNDVSKGRSSAVGKQNPAIALNEVTHDAVSDAQRDGGLHKPATLKGQTAQQNIDMNAKILEKTMVANGADPAVAKAKTAKLKKDAEDFADKHVPPCKRG